MASNPPTRYGDPPVGIDCCQDFSAAPFPAINTIAFALRRFSPAGRILNAS
jgi:hypothetical protein